MRRTGSGMQRASGQRDSRIRRITADYTYTSRNRTISDCKAIHGYRTDSETQADPAPQIQPRRRRRKRHRELPRLMAITLLFVLVAAWSVYGFCTSPNTLPDWVSQDLLPKNPYSRPGDALSQVNGVVIHYVGVPGRMAKQQRDYFAKLADTHETQASCHFLIDQDGTVVQCIPLDEIAYCNGERNGDTIAIECCHPDDSGSLTLETLASLQKLVNWLNETYHLQREDILRHYDVSGMSCPRWFVDHPEAWESFLDSLSFPDP